MLDDRVPFHISNFILLLVVLELSTKIAAPLSDTSSCGNLEVENESCSFSMIVTVVQPLEMCTSIHLEWALIKIGTFCHTVAQYSQHEFYTMAVLAIPMNINLLKWDLPQYCASITALYHTGYVSI